LRPGGGDGSGVGQRNRTDSHWSIRVICQRVSLVKLWALKRHSSFHLSVYL
jgi:hypothetical protein